MKDYAIHEIYHRLNKLIRAEREIIEKLGKNSEKKGGQYGRSNLKIKD